MIHRTLHDLALLRARRNPVVVITGPRQSGKTTLCRMAFGDRPYASLEPPDVREFATSDPRGFLAQFPDGAVLDEVQRAPQLLSYLQEIVDRRRRNGLFILTGSQHFGLLEAVSQSLAGRSAVLHLLPLALEELRRFRHPSRDLFSTLFKGSYPRIHEQRLPPSEWLADYVATYVERDVRQVLNVGDLTTFQTFLRICAGRSGQLVNLSGLAADCGVSHNTARAWLSVLETGFIVFRLPPMHRNLGKRLIKSPKLHFFDSGLLCYLLGIRSADQLRQHPLRGAVFESWVASEIYKARVHRGAAPDLYFYRDRKGSEVDLFVDSGTRVWAVEVKSGATVSKDFMKPVLSLTELLAAASEPTTVESLVVYGGDQPQTRGAVRVVPWARLDGLEWAETGGATRAARTRRSPAPRPRARPRARSRARARPR